MRWWLNKYLIFLFVFSLLIQASYGQEVNQTPNDTNQSQKNGIGSSPTITIQNVTTIPITIELNSTNDLPVKETTVEVFDNGTKILDLYTTDNGLTFFQANQSKTYRFVIEAESYEKVNKSITILSGINKIKFTLKPKDSNFFPFFIPAVIGFITFVYWSIRFYHGRFIPHSKLETLTFNAVLVLLILSWPGILLYLLYKGIENLLLGGISFSVYVAVASLIGVLDYLLLSLQETFVQTIPKYKKKSIEFGYIRRITIAPYIALLGVYLLDVTKVQNILLFSFFTGMFTKTVEEWLYKSIQNLLPQDLQKEIKERIDYNIENSELVVKLKVNEDVAYTLYKNDIRTVEQLACLNTKVTDKRLGRILQEISPDCLKENIDDAKKQKKEIDELKKLLATSELYLLIDKAKVYSITDFAYLDLDSIDWGMKTPTDNKKITDLFKQKQNKAKSIASSEEELKFLTLDDLKKLHADFKDKTPEDYIEIVKLHTEIREKGISNWTVEDTKKLFDQQIKTLDELKTRCINQGKDNVKKELQDISVISELIDKII